jgi:hypothetical protein
MEDYLLDPACHVLVLTIDGLWIDTRIYWSPKYTIGDYTLQLLSHRLVVSITVFTVPMITASNGGRSPFSGFLNCSYVSATATLLTDLSPLNHQKAFSLLTVRPPSQNLYFL